jgi:Domain of unknown function (DUF4158)
VVGVATRDVFSEQEMGRLRGFPEITRAELIRYFTLTSAEEEFLRKFLGRRNVLGASVQLEGERDTAKRGRRAQNLLVSCR